MRRPLRLALAALGLVAVLYGLASLTGGWLGTPPWESSAEERSFRWEEVSFLRPNLTTQGRYEAFRWDDEDEPEQSSRRQWAALAITAAGLALAAFALWPRGTSSKETA